MNAKHIILPLPTTSQPKLTVAF